MKNAYTEMIKLKKRLLVLSNETKEKVVRIQHGSPDLTRSIAFVSGIGKGYRDVVGIIDSIIEGWER